MILLCFLNALLPLTANWQNISFIIWQWERELKIQHKQRHEVCNSTNLKGLLVLSYLDREIETISN